MNRRGIGGYSYTNRASGQDMPLHPEPAVTKESVEQADQVLLPQLRREPAGGPATCLRLFWLVCGCSAPNQPEKNKRRGRG